LSEPKIDTKHKKNTTSTLLVWFLFLFWFSEGAKGSLTKQIFSTRVN